MLIWQKFIMLKQMPFFPILENKNHLPVTGLVAQMNQRYKQSSIASCANLVLTFRAISLLGRNLDMARKWFAFFKNIQIGEVVNQITDMEMNITLDSGLEMVNGMISQMAKSIFQFAKYFRHF